MQQIADLCHQQALLAKSICSPNPAVGAVIFGKDNLVLGVGHTQKRGEAHAEVMALRDAARRGNDVRGSNIFVSLEPCSHQGRTGPCCDALIQAGIKKVYASAMDPNPLVSGQGFARLRAAGIEVHIGIDADLTVELNIGFFSRMRYQFPWVRTKIASSLDGKTALANGKSKWITSEASREDGHKWRAKSDAIVTGVGTILKDNPRLDVRGNRTASQQPILAIADSRLETPVDSELFKSKRQVLIYGAVRDEKRKADLESAGAKVIILPLTNEFTTHKVEKVNLAGMMTDLARQEINEVHVEAGSRLNGALIKAQLIDEVILYLAPKFLGPGLGMIEFNAFENLEDAVLLKYFSMDILGEDIRVVGRFLNKNSLIPGSFKTDQ